MKTLFPLLASLALFAMFSPAQASPDCTTVDPTSRLAECHGMPNFATEAVYRGNDDDDNRNHQYRDKARPAPEPEPEPEPDPV